MMTASGTQPSNGAPIPIGTTKAFLALTDRRGEISYLQRNQFGGPRQIFASLRYPIAALGVDLPLREATLPEHYRWVKQPEHGADIPTSYLEADYIYHWNLAKNIIRVLRSENVPNAPEVVVKAPVFVGNLKEFIGWIHTSLAPLPNLDTWPHFTLTRTGDHILSRAA